MMIALTAVIGLLVARSAIRHRKANLAIMRQYRVRHILAALAGTAAVLGTYWGLVTLFPVLARNPFLWAFAALFHHGSGAGQGNIIMSGLQWKWYAVAFLPVLILAVPRFALLEEIQYRKGTRSWPHGIARSLRFGLAHVIMLIPLGAALALTWGGILFTWAYFRGGVESSTVYHAAFNTVVITIVLISVLAAF